MKYIIFTLFLIVNSTTRLSAQPVKSRYSIHVDVSHGQTFWNDPVAMTKGAGQDSAVARDLTNQLRETASSLGASVDFLKAEITTEGLASTDLLFIHMPSAQYSNDEVAAIKQYVRQGGSLFLVLDVDSWSTLEQTNVNDIIKPFNIQFGQDSSDSLSGGYTTPSAVVSKKMDVIYHGGRLLEGGIAFCFNRQSNEAFGTYQVTENGGKVVAMGDGMASLYMTDWEETNYSTQQFMTEVVQWLLK